MRRAKIIKQIRQFFWELDFVETDTPHLVESPGMEPHIRPVFIANPGVFLATSPEFAMKRILANPTLGLTKIFQICKAYRYEPVSSTHSPEFTILEWYRANATYEALFTDCENLIRHLIQDLGMAPQHTATLETPWPRLSLNDCFQRFCGITLKHYQSAEDLEKWCLQNHLLTDTRYETILHNTNYSRNDRDLLLEEYWNDLFFLIVLNKIEPRLKEFSTPIFLYGYPESQAALANVYTDGEGMRWAKRFELYWNGLELANAFDELTDPILQRQRFQKDQKIRRLLYDAVSPQQVEAIRIPQESINPIESPIDEAFLTALDTLPPSAGIALGVDRLVMALTQTENIDDVLWQRCAWRRCET